MTTEFISTNKFHGLHQGLGNIIKFALEAKFKPGVMFLDVKKNILPRRLVLTADERNKLVYGGGDKPLKIYFPAVVTNGGGQQQAELIEWVETRTGKVEKYQIVLFGKPLEGDPSFARFAKRDESGELVEETAPFKFPDPRENDPRRPGKKKAPYIYLQYFSHQKNTEFLPLFVKLDGNYYQITSKVQGYMVTQEVTAQEVPPHLISA